MCVEQLKAFEGLDNSEQIDKVCEELSKAGFASREVKSSKGTVNIHYIKEGCDLVFTVIDIQQRGLKQAAIYEKCMFDEFIYDEQGGIKKRTITLKDRSQKDKGYVPYISSGGLSIYMHRLFTGVKCRSVQVDHVAHNFAICTKDFLRTCTTQENKFNTKFYSKVDKADMKFTAPCKLLTNDERISYKKKGYSFKKSHIISPSFASMKELYEAVEDYENRYLKNFRYKPLYDFSETLYAFVAWKMLEWGNEADITEYNRDFILRNHPETAEYYQLGV